jgi:long-chain acyl-CoA synthetase
MTKKTEKIVEMERWNSLPAMFFAQLEKHRGDVLLSAKQEGKWSSLTWAESADKIARLAEGLKRLGVKKGDRVALLSENRPEWVIADIAIMALGAVAVPLYTTYTTRDHRHVLENSGAHVAIVSTEGLARAFLPAAHELDTMRHAILIEPLELSQHINIELYRWDEVMEANPGDIEALKQGAEALRRDDTSCIIYTSGTGGSPKGVILHHGSILHNCEGAYEVLYPFGIAGNRFLSFLPMSHAFGHLGDIFLPIAVGAEIHFAESLDKLGANMLEVKPAVMLVVPRLFEMIKGRVETAVEKQGGKKEKLFRRTLELGRKKLDDPASLTFMEKVENKCLDILVRKKIQAHFGGKIKAMVSGGAALNPDVGSFFRAFGLTMLQGYGQTETGPLISVNCLPDIRTDATGPPVKNTEVKIAEDGEILVRGELVMKGYWRNRQATAEVIKDGWLHTGDIGCFTELGHLKITDRKKDIIVFDKGDNVSPQRIEGLLTLEPEIAQAMVYGDGHSYLVGLIVPDELWLKKWAAENGRDAAMEILKDDKNLVKAIHAVVSRVNGKLSNLEKVRKFILSPHLFTVENRQMTPTLKIRRHTIKAEFGDQLEGLY